MTNLVQRLQAAARDCDRRIWTSYNLRDNYATYYNQDMCDLRNLLEEAARALETRT